MKNSGDNKKMVELSSVKSRSVEDLEPRKYQTRVFGSDIEALNADVGGQPYRLFDHNRHVLKVKKERPRVVDFDLKIKGFDVKIEMAEEDYSAYNLRNKPKNYLGQPIAVVSWVKNIGRPGLPWSRGTLRLEHHPDLTPVLARGRGTDVGALWKLRSMPQVADTIEPIIGTAKSAPWRIEPNEAATGETPNPLALEQHEWCLRSWRQWTKSGLRYGWDRWIEDLLRFCLICGFYVGEISLNRRKDHLNLPMLRAPWTIDEWILQGEVPIGVVQEFSDTATTFGGDTKTQVVLPWEKILHVPFRPAGPSDLEGYSLIRPAYTPLTMLIDTYRIQGLSISINGMGTWKLSQSTDRPFTPEEKEDLMEHFGNYEGGHVPWVIMPPGGDAVLMTAQAGIVDLSSAIITLERSAGMALGSSHKLIALHQHGSFAARSSASEEQRDNFDAFGKLCSTAAQRLFAKGLQAKYGVRSEIFPPKISHSAIEERDNSKRAATIIGLVQAGIIRPNASMERSFLEENDLPTNHLNEQTEEENPEDPLTETSK